jgi:hypothetical protein
MPNDLTEMKELPAVAAFTPVQLPSKEELERKTSQWMALVQGYVIDSPEALEMAADDRNQMKDTHEWIEALRVHIKKPLLTDVRRVDGFFKLFTEPLELARKLMDQKIAGYIEQQRQEQAELERRARELAERAAAEKRAAAAKVEAETLAKAEALRRQAEEARAAGQAGKAAKLESKAVAQASAGQAKAADLELQATLAATTTTLVLPTVAAPEGVGITYDYVGEVSDMAAFMRFVCEQRPDLMALFEVRQTGLNAQVRSLKDRLNWPGVTVKKVPRGRDTRRQGKHHE